MKSTLERRPSSVLNRLSSRQAEWLSIIGLVASAAWLFMEHLGRGALRDWDEATYAEVAKEIVSRHEWLTLYWQHQPFFEKPPLSFWLQAVLFQHFGVTEFWARFPSAMAGIGIVVLVFALGKRLAGARAGLLAGAVLLTTRGFDNIVRQGMTDTLLCFCIYLALYGYVRMRQDNGRWLYLVCAALACGVLVKGPAVLVVVLAIGVERVLRHDALPIVGWRRWVTGSLIFLGIAAPWFLWMVLRYGKNFVSVFAGHQLALRATQVLENSGGGPLYYVSEYLVGGLPWSVLLIPVFVWWLRRRDARQLLIWCLVGTTLVLYSLISTKHGWYILPVYPAVAITTGIWISEITGNRRVLLPLAIVFLLVGIVATGAMIYRRNGDALAGQMAQLSALAKKPGSPDPLLIIAKAGTEASTAPGIPTVVFYSGRTAKSFDIITDKAQIARFIGNRSSVDAVIQNSALRDVSSELDVAPIAQTELLTYATLSLKP
jgi:4-amino-4-deoxy-L-arabinose transferase-like glycosyltransferase